MPLRWLASRCRSGSPMTSPVSMAGSANGRAGEIGDFPADPRRQHQRQRAGRDRADPPAILRHARADAELARLEQLDPVGVDDDVEGRARDADEDRGHRSLEDVGGRILEGEIGDRGHDQHAGDDQPGHALPEPAEHGDADAVDDPGPEELEIVDEEGEREGGDRRLRDPVLRQPRRQRRADHRIGKARRDAEEEGRDRRGLRIGADAGGKGVAPAGAARSC